MIRPLGVVVVGYGYWGPNIVRNVLERPELELLALCERDAGRAGKFAARYPDIPTLADFDAVLADPLVDAVCIATPPRTHHVLVRRALEAGKHVLVEKPLATSTARRRGPRGAGRGARADADARPHVPLQPARQQGAAS